MTTLILSLYHHPRSTSGLVELEGSTYNRPILVTSNSFTTATSINFTILNPDSKSAALYQTPCNNLTLLTNSSLPHRYITQLSPSSFIRDGYNYDVDEDVPINLAPGSSLTYIMSANSTSSDPGCLKLYLFDSFSAYNSFLGTKDNSVNDYVTRSHCINVSTSGPPAQSIIVFNITDKQTSYYYVAFETPGHIAFDANISVLQTYYDTSGLELQCFHRLTSSKPSCIIDRCDHSFLNNFVCFDIKKDDTCFLIDSTTTVNVTYQTRVAIFNGNSSYTFFATLATAVLLLAVLISCLLLRCCCWLCRRIKKNNGQIEIYESSIDARHELSTNHASVRTLQYTTAFGTTCNQGKT